VLPAASAGPAVLLVSPYNDLTRTLATTFAQAELIEQPAHLGGDPFRLYIIYPPSQQAASQGTFSNQLQLLSVQPFQLQAHPGSSHTGVSCARSLPPPPPA